MEKLTKEQEKELNTLWQEIRALYHELNELTETIGLSEYVQTQYSLQDESGIDPTFTPIFPDYDSGRARIGLYSASSKTEPDFEHWKDTFFYTHRIAAESLGRTVLAADDSTRLRNAQKYHPPFISDMDYMYGKYVASVEAVLYTSKGPRLVLADPYGSTITDPCPEIDMDFAESLIGKIVLAQVGHKFDSDSHPLKKLQITPYHKYEKHT